MNWVFKDIGFAVAFTAILALIMGLGGASWIVVSSFVGFMTALHVGTVWLFYRAARDEARVVAKALVHEATK